MNSPSHDARGDTYVEIVTNNQHWRIAARALALDFDDGELAVLRRLARLDAAEVLADGVEDVVRAAQHARRRRAHLHKVLADRLPAAQTRARQTARRTAGGSAAHRLNIV